MQSTAVDRATRAYIDRPKSEEYSRRRQLGRVHGGGESCGIGKLCVLVAVLFVGMAEAALPTTANYSGVVSNSRMAYVTGSVSEAWCTSSCTQSYVVKLPTGYSASAAAIWLNFYFLEFDDSAGGNINRAKLMVSKTSYNSSTGDFTWTLDADLTANTAPTNTRFNVGVWFTIAVGDNTNVRLAQKTANNFTGAGANGECDSSAACTDSTTFASVGTTGANFRRMTLRGFEVGTQSAAGLSLTKIAFDATGYSGTTSASGSTTCTLTASASPAENLDCEVGLSAVAFATTNLTNQDFTDGVTGVTGNNYTSVALNSTSGSASTNFIAGLQKTTLTPASSMTFKRMLTGCGALYWSSTPGTGSSSGQGNHGLLRPSTSINFDGDFKCFTGFLY